MLQGAVRIERISESGLRVSGTSPDGHLVEFVEYPAEQHPFIVGVVEWKQESVSAGGTSHTIMAPYNSALMFDGQGRREFSYDKVHLVPFGEYEPFPLIHRVVSNVSSEVGGFRKGTRYAVGQFANGYSFGVFICYHIGFVDGLFTPHPNWTPS